MTTPLQRTSLGELGYSPLAATSLGELGFPIAPIDDGFLPGGGGKKRHGPSARQIQIQQELIEEENAVMLSVIKAFLKMVD